MNVWDIFFPVNKLYGEIKQYMNGEGERDVT